MADESDVEQELSNLAFAALYPIGSGSLSAVGVTINGALVNCDGLVGRGWPEPASLAALLASSPPEWNVSIYSRNGVERNTTRYTRDFQISAPAVNTLTATVANNTVTIGGTVSTPQNVMVLTSRTGAFAYSVQPNDTLSSIAAGVAAALAVRFPGTSSSGPVVTVATAPGLFGQPGLLTARVVGAGTAVQEVARVDKSFQVSVWAPLPTIRDKVCSLLMPALIVPTFIPLADGSKGFCRYERSIQMDGAQVEGLYRRDLFFCVEYPTTVFVPAYQIGTVNVNDSAGQASPPQAPPVPGYY